MGGTVFVVTIIPAQPLPYPANTEIECCLMASVLHFKYFFPAKPPATVTFRITVAMSQAKGIRGKARGQVRT